MNLAVPSICCLYSGLRDIVEFTWAKGDIGRKNTYLPLQYLCAWLCLHFPSIYQVGGKNLKIVSYINTLKNQHVEKILWPIAYFCFTKRLILILDHLFNGHTLIDNGLLGHTSAH